MRKSASPAERHNPESPEPTQVGRPSSDRAADVPDWVTRVDLHPSRAVHGGTSEAVNSSATDGCAHQSKYVMLNAAEYAALFRVSTKTIRRMVDRGDLHAVRIGHSFRIRVSTDLVNTLRAKPHCFK